MSTPPQEREEKDEQPLPTHSPVSTAIAATSDDDDEGPKCGKTSETTTNEVRQQQHQKNKKDDVKAIIAQLEAEVQRLRTTIETELSEVQPVLQAGIDALNSLKAEHLVDVRSLRQCPTALQDLLSCIAIVVDDPCGADPNWSEIRKMLGRREFMSALRNFDATTLLCSGRGGGRATTNNGPVYVAGGGPNRLERVERYIAMHPDSFDLEKARRVSKAGGLLLVWLQGQLAYAKVFWRGEPLRVVFEEKVATLRECVAELEKMEE